MPYPIENKFVIAVSASALFDTSEEEKVFAENGLDAYKKYQRENEDKIYGKGLAFDFISRFLGINNFLQEEQPAEVVLFTRNSPDLGGRFMKSIQHYGLNINRTCFSSGDFLYKYLPSFNVSLFLSCNEEHTRAAINAGFAAGTVLQKEIKDEIQSATNDDVEFAFDFDGVLASDEAERRYRENNKELDVYYQNESNDALKPLEDGPLKSLMDQIAKLQRIEEEKVQKDNTYRKRIKTALITARNAPADRRVITTLEKLGIKMDKAFFMGGVDKSRVINIMRPQIFFDDDKRNLENLSNVVAVHVPFGVVYEEQVEQNSEETKAYSTRKKRAQGTPKAPTITQKDIDELNRRN